MSGPLRLLIIEDSEDDALLIARTLKRGGYEPHYLRVDTAPAVHAALEREPWDVVLSDFSMPYFNGLDALKLLRDRDADIPFIFVSGTIGEEVAVEAMRAGAQDYVIKGNLSRLVPSIERALREVAVRRDRRRAVQQLAESEARLRAITEASFDGIAIIQDGIVRDANRGCAAMLGYAVEELIGRPFATFVLAAGDVDPLLGAGIEGSFELHGKRKDGRMIQLEATIKRHTVGDRSALITALRDVTERRLLEAQLRQAQKMESVGQLAGGVAHDFNNVLTAIFGYADLIASILPANSPALRDLEEICKAAERAAALTRQLLAFSRSQVLNPVVLNVNALVRDIESMLRPLVGASVTQRLSLAPDVGNVRADANQIQQVIMNLAVNARDAMATGGTLIIETGNEELTGPLTVLHQDVIPGSYVMLAVSDTGAGMDAETQSRIFEPFFTTKEKGRGTGLGLSTVYGIVKQSEGYISVHSELGRGTTFKIYLPRVDAPADRPAAPPAVETLTGTETVLLAEDDDMLRPLAKALLEKLGYAVLEAQNAEQALTLARAHARPIHLLIADLVMPGQSGRELASQLAEARPGIRVLFVSGYTDAAIAQHGMLEPGRAFLQKPFTPGTLARTVREVLDSPQSESARTTLP